MDLSAREVWPLKRVGVLRLARCLFHGIELLRVAPGGFHVALLSSGDGPCPVSDRLQIDGRAGCRFEHSYVRPMAHLQRIKCRKMSGGEAVVLEHSRVVINLRSAGDDL